MKITERSINAARSAWDAVCAAGQAGPDYRGAWEAALYAASCESDLESIKAQIDHSEKMSTAAGEAARSIYDQIRRMEETR